MKTPHLVIPQHCGELDWVKAERHDTLDAAETAVTERQAIEDAAGASVVWRLFELREPVWTGRPHCGRCGAFRPVVKDALCQPCLTDGGWGL